jgi:hypothetical protein
MWIGTVGQSFCLQVNEKTEPTQQKCDSAYPAIRLPSATRKGVLTDCLIIAWK